MDWVISGKQIKYGSGRPSKKEITCLEEYIGLDQWWLLVTTMVDGVQRDRGDFTECCYLYDNRVITISMMRYYL